MMMKYFSSVLFLIISFNLLQGQVNDVCDKIFEVENNGNIYSFPFCSNKTLSSNPAIKKVVVLIHGQDRNAPSRYGSLLTSAGLSGVSPDSTLLVTPQFLIEEDLIEHNLSSSFLFWTNVFDGWKYGYNSTSSATYPNTADISSFVVMEEMLSTIAESCPNLNSIVITGHSAGGQFVNRFAAANTFETPDQEFCTSYISLNAGTFMYLNEERRVEGSEDQFEVPTTCTNHNRYKYGLSNYNGCDYIENIGKSEIIEKFETRNYTILNGENDNDPNDSGINNNDCKELVQGEHRLERSKIYYNHLLNFYGPEVGDKFQHMVVPNAGHSTHEMITSDIGRYLLFGKPCCSDVYEALLTTICEGESVELPDGQVVTTGGNYTVTLEGVIDGGCDRISDIVVEVLPNEIIDTIVSIVEGEVVELPDGSIVGEAGEYQAILVGGATNGCDQIINTTVDIISSTGELADENALKVFPNPSNESFIIENGKGNLTQIYDIQGRKILEQKGDIIDVSRCLPGIYIIRNGSSFGKVTIY